MYYYIPIKWPLVLRLPRNRLALQPITCLGRPEADVQEARADLLGLWGQMAPDELS